MRVSSVEFVRNYGTLADRALSEAVTITRNGRDRLVVLSAEEYKRLLSRSRRVLLASEVSEADLALIAEAEVPAGHESLDREMEADE